MNTNSDMAAVMRALERLRIPAMAEEYDLHDMIRAELEKAGLEYRHEFPLGPRRRIDFAVGRIGIEVKKGKPDRKQLIRQLERYMESGLLDCVIVVCPRGVRLPDAICGRPVVGFSVNRLWGVALP